MKRPVNDSLRGSLPGQDRPGVNDCGPVLLIFIFIFGGLPLMLTGCQTPSGYRLEADRTAQAIIQEKESQLFGRTREFSLERPEGILRRRLLMEQDLPRASQASLGPDQLDMVPHWPEKVYPLAKKPSEEVVTLGPGQPLRLSLRQALQVGAWNSPEYQTRKEEVFKAALELDLRRHDFGTIAAGGITSSYSVDKKGAGANEDLAGFEHRGSLSLGQTFYNGLRLTAALTMDLVKLLTQGRVSSYGLSADASIAIPLLRGAGRHLVTEPLTQAERNVVYAMYDLERFKKTLAVALATSYLDVLEQLGQVDNTAENYQNLTVSARRTRALADAGRATEIEVDRVLQEELKARERWVTALKTSEERLDDFKRLLGLPPDADISLERNELDHLKNRLSPALTRMTEEPGYNQTARERMGPDASPEGLLTGQTKAGVFEMSETEAIRAGLENRLDLLISQGKVLDAQRAVVIQADALRAELTLLGKTSLGGARTLYTADQGNIELKPDRGIYTGLFTLDLPLERTAERNAYRNSYLALERAVRDFQKMEDEVKRDIRNSLREMSRARERLLIQRNALALAEKRVRSTEMFFEAGRAELRDLLEAQEALLTARNTLTEVRVDYRVSGLNFQRDTGLLSIDEQGLIQEEITPEDNHDHER